MKKLDKKLKKYSALAAGVVMVSNAGAQIQYTDVSPDSVITLGDFWLIDIDGNLTPDFTFGVASSSSSGGLFVKAGAIMGYGSNGVIGYTYVVGSSTVILGSRKNFSSTVTSGNNFYAGGSTSANPPVVLGAKAYFGTITVNTFGDFPGATDGYLGLKFDISSTTHYGWMRLAVSADALTYTIKDWAYEATADSSIHIGSTNTGSIGVDENYINNNVGIFSFNNVITITVNDKSYTNGKADIVDMSGRVVASFDVNDDVVKFSGSELSSGIYAVTVRFDQGMKSSRVYVK